jgi:hypothetical protein
MTTDEMISRLRAGNPVSAERALRAADAPWAAALRDRLLELDPAPLEGAKRTRTRPWPLMAAAAALVVAGAGAVAANELRTEVAPNTPEGARFVRDFLQNLREHTPLLPGDRPSDFALDPGTARVVFSARTRHGEYTIWRARAESPRGGALLFSSPRIGFQGAHGVFRRLPRAPYLWLDGGGGSPVAGARELYGRVSPSVVAVRAQLKNGRREPAMVAGGWFVFTQDFGHAKPIRLDGLDRRGRVVATWTKGLS